MKAGAVRKLSGAEQRALREQITAADPAAEAWAHESSFLRCLATAQEDFDWIVANEAWTVLGHDTFADWWDARAPRMREMGFEPTRQIALAVLARIRSDEEKLPRAQRRTNKQLAVSVGLSETSIRRIATRSLPAPADAEADLENTSAAGPAANPEGDSPVLGEPVDVGVAAASTGTQTAAEGADTTEADGAQTVRAVPEHAFLSGEAPAPDGDAAPSSSGVTRQDLAEEEAVEPPVDTPAAATTSLPDGDGDPMPEQSQQPGQDSPTGVEGPRSETDSPTGLEAAQPRDDRSETSHHAPAGVSGVGEAPEEPRPSAEPVELEDGDGSPRVVVLQRPRRRRQPCRAAAARRRRARPLPRSGRRGRGRSAAPRSGHRAAVRPRRGDHRPHHADRQGPLRRDAHPVAPGLAVQRQASPRGQPGARPRVGWRATAGRLALSGLIAAGRPGLPRHSKAGPKRLGRSGTGRREESTNERPVPRSRCRTGRSAGGRCRPTARRGHADFHGCARESAGGLPPVRRRPAPRRACSEHAVSVEGEINGLYPTRHRIALLKAVEQPGRVYGEANDVFDKVAGSRVHARVKELLAHGWIEPVPREEQHRDEWSQTWTYYRLAAFGRAAIERGRR